MTHRAGGRRGAGRLRVLPGAERSAPTDRPPRPTVLVVENDPAIRTLVAQVMADEGYAVSTASHGGAALLAVRRRPPDLVLLDLQLPVVDGAEFARRYRRTPAPHAPLVVLSPSSTAPSGRPRSARPTTWPSRST